MRQAGRMHHNTRKLWLSSYTPNPPWLQPQIESNSEGDPALPLVNIEMCPTVMLWITMKRRSVSQVWWRKKVNPSVCFHHVTPGAHTCNPKCIFIHQVYFLHFTHITVIGCWAVSFYKTQAMYDWTLGLNGAELLLRRYAAHVLSPV